MFFFDNFIVKMFGNQPKTVAFYADLNPGSMLTFLGSHHNDDLKIDYIKQTDGGMDIAKSNLIFEILMMDLLHVSLIQYLAFSTN